MILEDNRNQGTALGFDSAAFPPRAAFFNRTEFYDGFGPAQFELKSKEEAVESAVRFMELHKKYWPGWEGETEVRQMFEPEDFVGCSKAVIDRP
jgi:hypothetical protein